MEIEAEKTIQQIEAGNWLRAQLSRRGVLEAFGLAAIAVACAPKTSSLSPTPEVAPTSTEEPTPTPEVTPKEPTPEEKIHTFLKEVLKPEVYNPVGPPKLVRKEKNLDGTHFYYQYEWNMGEWKGILLKVYGTYSESIKGEKYVEDGLPLSISIRIIESQKRLDRLVPSNMNQIVGEYFTLPATVPPWRYHPLPNTPRTPLETLWDNPDGTKEGRLAVVFGNISSDGYGNYYLDASKIFKDFPGYSKETLFGS